MKKNLTLALVLACGFLTACAAKEQQIDRAKTIDSIKAPAVVERPPRAPEILVPATQKLFDDLNAIAGASKAYQEKVGRPPAKIADLVAEKFLESAPKPDCTVLDKCTDATRYEIANWRDNDGNGQPDIVVSTYDGGDSDIDLCLAFNAQHTSLGRTIWKNKALGNNVWEDGKPPSWPHQDQVFCVCWHDNCETDQTGLGPGDNNIIILLAH